MLNLIRERGENMFNKVTTFKIIESNVLDSPMLYKNASPTSLPEPYDADFLYVRVRAVSAGEFWGPNRNADFFSEDELKSHYKTFLDAHVFKNHENKDVAKSIGRVLTADWNDEMKYVELLIKIDRKLAPSIVRGFEKGYTTDVSMGCRVKKTICSICGNEASTRAQFCSHVNKERNNIYPDGRRVFEYNISPSFHDISVVLKGADRTAKNLEIVASSYEDSLEKVASSVLSNPSPLYSEDILLSKCAEIHKLSEFKKRVLDKLYTITLLNRLVENESLEEDLEELESIASSDLDLQLIKHADMFSLKNRVLGSVPLAMSTNYYQGKRLRGENLNSFQHFIADNPGLLPLAYIVGSKPAYKSAAKGAKHLKGSLKGVVDSSKGGFTKLFTKQASDVAFSCDGPDILSDSNLLTRFKTAYDKTDNEISMIKLALCMYEAGREDIVDSIKVAYNINDEDITNFVKLSCEFINESLDKEAVMLEYMIANNLFVKPGRTAASLPALIVDGLLVNKVFSSLNKPEKVTKNKDIIDQSLQSVKTNV